MTSEDEIIATLRSDLRWNHVHELAVPNLPLGGVGGSGMGSYHGIFSFDAFSNQKAVLQRSFDADLSVRYPLYTPCKQQLLKALVNGNLIDIVRALLGLDA